MYTIDIFLSKPYLKDFASALGGGKTCFNKTEYAVLVEI